MVSITTAGSLCVLCALLWFYIRSVDKYHMDRTQRLRTDFEAIQRRIEAIDKDGA